MTAHLSHTTLPFQIDPKEPEWEPWIHALRLAVDVHLVSHQLPEGEQPYLGAQLHTTARAIARRLARRRVLGCNGDVSCFQRAAARLIYLLRLARDLGWLPAAVAKPLEERCEDLRSQLSWLASGRHRSPKGLL
ncbi:MAG: four helix bundle protein [Deltaproteobacteria bacterium]|nr:four helix bundle protein [Deltaproteobacteria bacterium]